MALTKILGVNSVSYYPTRLKGIAPVRDYAYGQVGTKITREVVFSVSASIAAILLKYGFAKNSDSIFRPTNALDPDLSYQIGNDFFNNLITGVSQSYTGEVGQLTYMNPLSGKDGTATLESFAITPATWDTQTTYNKGDVIERTGVNYISIQDSNKNNNPLTTPEWWQIAYTYKVTQDFIIQPLATINDFDDAGNYIKPEILQNFESAKPVYQIDAKESVTSPVVIASTTATDPEINEGFVGFFDEKLNGLQRDITLSDLKVNDFEFTFREDTNNTFEFVIESNQYTLSLVDTLVQIIAYDLTPPENTNIPYLDLINYSNAIEGESSGYVTNVGVLDLGGGKLQVSGNVQGLKSDVPVVIYANIIANTAEESEQTFLLFYGNPLVKEADPAFRLKQIYAAPQREIQFFPEFSEINTDFAFNNVAAFVDDIIVSRADIEQLNDLAQLDSITVSLINGGSEVLQTFTVLASQLPYSAATNYQINSVDRDNTTVVEFIESYLQIKFPFKILESWTAKEGIRLTYQINYTLNGVSGSDVIESAPLRLGNYDETKNTEYEPQVLASYTEKIKILSEDGTVAVNQFNTGSNVRLKTQFQDTNPVTDDLQVLEADLTGFYGIALPSSPDNLHYLHKEFGALGSTFYKVIDGSLSPELKITKTDNRTAEYEAIVDVDSMRSILGESDTYHVVCRCDKVEEAKETLDQYSFIFNNNTPQKYNFTLDADLLTGALLSVYYSVNYPPVLTFTHVPTATSFTSFESFKAYINSNAISGEVITIETLSTSIDNWGSIPEAIVKISIPRTASIPVGSVGLANSLLSNYVEHENIYVFDSEIDIDSFVLSGSTASDLYYALRSVGGELTEFRLYNKQELNAALSNANLPVIMHLWGARNGGSNTIAINYNILNGNKILRTANVYGQNGNTLRPAWSLNSFIFNASQWLVVGDAVTPYRQIEVRENFTFFFVFWQDAISGSRRQLFTTNSRLSAVPNSFLSFHTLNKDFNVQFVDYSNPSTAKTLNYSGLGIKAGYNFVIGHWDATNANNRHIFINGFLQDGTLTNTNSFDVNTDSCLNAYDEALYGANDFDTTASEFFTGKMFNHILTKELFQDRASIYRQMFLKGSVAFDSSKILLSTDFNKTNGVNPDIKKDGTTNYPVSPRNATTYVNFNTLA